MIRCPNARCHAEMRAVIVQFGKVDYVCDPCIRVAAGLCVDCPQRRVGKSRRCDGCKKQRHLSHGRGKYPLRATSVKAYRKHRYWNDPEFRQHVIDDACRRQAAVPRAIARAYWRVDSKQRRAKKAATAAA